jgi:hypothetical protein
VDGCDTRFEHPASARRESQKMRTTKAAVLSLFRDAPVIDCYRTRADGPRASIRDSMVATALAVSYDSVSESLSSLRAMYP